MRIITGSTGTTHVTSNDDGEFNQGIFGNRLVVLANGNRLSASIVDNNTIRIKDGDLVFQGRHALILPNTTEDISIETGTVGMNRNDLIVARYVLDASTGYESITLEVVKGEETSGTAVDPEITTGDIRTGSTIAEAALYKVYIRGVNISLVKAQFTVRDDIMSCIEGVMSLTNPFKPGDRYELEHVLLTGASDATGASIEFVLYLPRTISSDVKSIVNGADVDWIRGAGEQRGFYDFDATEFGNNFIRFTAIPSTSSGNFKPLETYALSLSTLILDFE